MARRKIERVGAFNIYKDSETQEFVVKEIGDRNPDHGYFTNDLTDARQTAQREDESRIVRISKGE